MTNAIMNARMYSVTPAVEALWRDLLAQVTAEAGVPLQYVAYPAPQPLEDLWSRPDLGCVFMCGYPVALKLAPVVPIAAPVPAAPWAAGRPQYRTAARPRLYGEMVPNLVTARAVLDAVREGRIDVGPLDAYWHILVARHAPALVEGVRVLESTDTATLPAFVAAASTPAATLDALRAAFAGATRRPWFGKFADSLLLDGFAAVEVADYARTLAWDRQARDSGYLMPA
jgi:hypothetical protein